MATSNPRIDRLVNGERIAVNYDSDLVKETASKYQRLPEQQVQMKQIERKESAAWRKNKVKIYNQVRWCKPSNRQKAYSRAEQKQKQECHQKRWQERATKNSINNLGVNLLNLVSVVKFLFLGLVDLLWDIFELLNLLFEPSARDCLLERLERGIEIVQVFVELDGLLRVECSLGHDSAPTELVLGNRSDWKFLRFGVFPVLV